MAPPKKMRKGVWEWTTCTASPGGLGGGRSGSRVSFWFRVSNIQQACEAVTKAGGTAGETFKAPEGVMSECFNDQGVKIGLVEPAPGF